MLLLHAGPSSSSWFTTGELLWADGVAVGNLPLTVPWNEISGIARSNVAANTGFMWVVSDEGVNPLVMRVFRLSDAADRGIWTLSSAVGIDVEDIATAAINGQPYLYIGDTGDNSAVRSTVNIWRVKEPTAFVTPASTYPFGDELIRYRFENDPGVLNSGTGSTTYNSTFQGNGAYTTTAKFGTYAAVFDGAGDAIDSKFGSGRNPASAPFSVSCWARRTVASAADQHLFGVSDSPSNNRCYVRWRQAVGKWGFRIAGNPTVESAVDATLNQWYHVCLVMDGTTARLYIDGTQVATSAYTSYTLPGPIYVGNVWLNGSADAAQGWQGQVDEYATYARALSAAEVLNIYNAGLSGGYTGGSLASGVGYEQIVCDYPITPTGEGGGVARDAESIFVDPLDGKIYLLTKRTTQVQLFSLAHQAFGGYVGTQRLTYEGNIFQLPSNPRPDTQTGRAVAADISPDGSEIVVKNYTTIYRFSRAPGQTILAALQYSTPDIVQGYVGGGAIASHPNSEPQGEGLMFGEDGDTLYTASEAMSTFDSGRTDYPLFRYTRLTEPLTEVTFQEGASGYAGTSDTYLYSASGQDAAVRGSEATFVVDYTSGTDERMGLLKFDLSSLPPGATIVGCDLQLYIDEAGSIAQVHRMLEAWSESTTRATLGHMPARNDVQASSAVEAYFGDYTGLTGLMTLKMPLATIQAWLDGTLTNNGWLFYQASTTDGNGFQFRSQQAATVADRPRLTVRYT